MTARQFVASNAEAVTEGLRGFCLAHANVVVLHTEPRFVTRTAAKEGKVALLSGGGSGHEPMHAGFVGEGMLDAAVPGEVFASPSAEQIAAATLAVDAGHGVLHIVKNYTGDVINFGVAAEQCRAAGVEVATVVVDDDVPSAERGSTPGRRGTVATVVVEKIVGAAAEEGLDLAALRDLGQRVVDASRSIGAAITAGSHFGSDEVAFELPAGKVEYGVGIHGERGTGRENDDGLAALMERFVADLDSDVGGLGSGPYLVIVNGLGTTTPLELYAAFAAVADALEARGVEMCRVVVDDLCTSLDMRGLSLTLVRMDDDLLRWWDAPAAAPSWGATTHVEVEAGTHRKAPKADKELPGDKVDLTDEARGQLAQWVDNFAEEAEARAKEFGDLDRQAGDGDFGQNLQTAAGRYRDQVRDGDNPVAALGRAFTAIGGTSGPLFGVWFQALADALGTDVSPEALAQGLSAGAAKVQELGGASPGDKTMVDAMVPAAEAAEGAASQGSSFADTVRAAADAAQKGAESTADLQAKRGRATYVGEVGRGVVDPGALAIAAFLRCGITD